MNELKRIYLDETDSTNSYAKRLAPGESRDLLIIAKRQTAGRGRSGRSFFSYDGGLYISLLLHPKPSLKRVESVTAMAAVAAAEAVGSVFGERAFIKWVNDIFVGGKKVCGILCEGSYDPQKAGFEYIVLGVGVNISMPDGGFPPELCDIAGALASGSSSRQKEVFLEEFLRRFFIFFRGEDDCMPEYKARSNILGRQIKFVEAGETKLATAIDITDSGELVIEDVAGCRVIRSGEIKICPDQLRK